MIKSRNLSNSLWSIFDVTVYPILFFAFTPFFIKCLGEEQYGVWMIANSCIIFSMFFIKPSMQVSTMFVAKFVAEENTLNLTKLLHTIWAITLFICSGLVLFSGLTAWIINSQFPQWIIRYKDLHYLIISVSLFAFVRLFCEVLIGGLHGFQRHDRAAQINFSTRIMNLISAIYMMKNGVALHFQFLVWGSFQVIAAGFYFLVFKKIGIPINLKIHSGKFKEINNYALHSLLQNFISIAYFQVDRFIVALKFGVISAGYYAIVSTIFNQLHRAFEAGINWFFPKMAGFKGNEAQVKQFFYSIRSTSLLAGTIVLLGFFYSESFLLKLWLGETTYGKLSQLIYFFILLEFTYLFSISGNLFMLGKNEMRLNTALEWTYKSLVILSMFLSAFIGDNVTDVVLYMSISMAIGMTIYNLAFYRKRRWTNYWRECSLYLLSTISFFSTILVKEPVFHLISVSSFVIIIYFSFVRNQFNLKLMLNG